MKLSILDQSPISKGSSSREALLKSSELTQLAEKLGYTRYWIAEHHAMGGLASPNPSALLSYIGAHTKHIRLGAGAVLLPHYSPFFIAETYHLLATLFPGRIDLGLGRAPGGSAEATMALSGDFLKSVRAFPDSLTELTQFLYEKFPPEHMYAKINITSKESSPPQPWLLGTSKRSAILAAEKGLPYAFGYFMSGKDGAEIIQAYQRNFKANYTARKPSTILAVSVICAETDEEAEELALSNQLWKVKQSMGESENKVPSVEEAKRYTFSKEEREEIEQMKQKTIVGNPHKVKVELEELQKAFNVDEFMIVTITHSYDAREKSYQLIAEQLLK